MKREVLHIMISFRFPTREQVTEYLQAKLTAFLHFAYNKESREYFGRDVTSWGEFLSHNEMPMVCMYYGFIKC